MSVSIRCKSHKTSPNKQTHTNKYTDTTETHKTVKYKNKMASFEDNDNLIITLTERISQLESELASVKATTTQASSTSASGPGADRRGPTGPGQDMASIVSMMEQLAGDFDGVTIAGVSNNADMKVLSQNKPSLSRMPSSADGVAEKEKLREIMAQASRLESKIGEIDDEVFEAEVWI
jgi:hypothetical protein